MNKLTSRAQAMSIGQTLRQQKPQTLQIANVEGVTPLISFGQVTKTLSFIDEVAKARKFGFTITNATQDDQFILIGGFGAENNTIFKDLDAIKAYTGATAIFGDGVILLDSRDNKTLDVTSTDPKRSVDQLVRYMCQTPLRFTRFDMRSRYLDGTKENSNYDNKFKSIWVSPLEDTVAQELDLPSLIDIDGYNTDMLRLDFQTQAPSFKAICSNENFLLIQVNAGTKLTITASIGAQMSSAQAFYRMIKAADETMNNVKSL